MIIAFDTSTAIAGVALFSEQGLVAECTWRSHRDQTAQLLPVAHHLLSTQNISPEALTGVAVSLGPGSFNGLRVGVSTGKGLALSLGLPIYGLSSLDMVAAQHRYINGTLCAVIEAGRGRLGIGFYRIKNGAWKRQGDYQNLTVEELAAQITAPTTIAGELNPAQLTFLEEKPGKHVLVLPPAIAFRRAGLLAEFAYSRMKAGDKGDDLANLQPIYLHQPVKTPGES